HPLLPPDYPDAATVPLTSVCARGEPRNCMPSLHTSWALLLYWQSAWHRPWVRRAAAGFLALTLLATIGFGYHYLWDLVVAVPFSRAGRAACARALPLRRPGRRRALGLGGALCAALLVLLRLGPGPLLLGPVLAWALAAAAVTAPLLAQQALARALPR